RLASVNGEPLSPQSYLLLLRLKSSEAIRRKMARFGEELGCMLDIWGIRLVLPDIDALDAVASLVQAHWADVPERQLMLRGGRMASGLRGLPKALVPIGGAPLLALQLSRLRLHGCTQAVVVGGHGIHHLRSALKAFSHSSDVVLLEETSGTLPAVLTGLGAL